MKKYVPITSLGQLKVGDMVKSGVAVNKMVLLVNEKVVLLSYSNDYDGVSNFYTLSCLKKNNYQLEVEEVKWRPVKGEGYYSPSPSFKNHYDWSLWNEDGIDIYRYEAGLVYKISKEAIDMTQKMLDVLKDNN